MAVTLVLNFIGILGSIVSSCISALIVARYDQLQTQLIPHRRLAPIFGVSQRGILWYLEGNIGFVLPERTPCGWQRDEDEVKFGFHAYYLHAFQQSTSLRDPSSTLFVLACVTYCLATSVLYRYSKDGTYHIFFLAAGVVSACAAGVYHAVDIQNIILSYLPWLVTAALTLSVIVSAIQRSLGNANKARTHYELEWKTPLRC